MSNITTNHAITYTYEVILLLYEVNDKSRLEMKRDFCNVNVTDE